MTSLPPEVFSLVEFTPLEDLALTALRAQFTEVPVQSLYAKGQPFPMILVRRGDDWGRPNNDTRFVQNGQLKVDTLCSGLNADEDAALLGEAVRVALMRSVNVVFPGIGHITNVDPIDLPRRVPDWATATGPVQYANLPEGVVRYEANYEVIFRRALA